MWFWSERSNFRRGEVSCNPRTFLPYLSFINLVIQAPFVSSHRTTDRWCSPDSGDVKVVIKYRKWCFFFNFRECVANVFLLFFFSWFARVFLSSHSQFMFRSHRYWYHRSRLLSPTRLKSEGPKSKSVEVPCRGTVFMPKLADGDKKRDRHPCRNFASLLPLWKTV